jgi:hypothetical protein
VIAAAPEDRVYLAQGDRLYVRGELGGATAFQVFRTGQGTARSRYRRQVLGYEAAYVGTRA